MQTFLSTLEQSALLLIFILAGYFLMKINVITADGRKVLAALLVNVFSPAYSIANLSKPGALSVEYVGQYIVYLLASLVLSILLIILAQPLSRCFAKERYQRNILKYAFAFGNIGYFGYPLIEHVFPELLPVYILFCLPMNIAVATYGYSILTEKTDNQPLDGVSNAKPLKQRLKFFYSVPFIGTMAGIILGLLPFNMPDFFINLMETAGKCQSATAMLITGSALASVPFLKLFTSWKPYAIGVVRLLLIPLIVIGIFLLINLCGVKGEQFIGIAKLCIIAAAMPIGMNTVVYPESAGMDGTEGAKICFMSYILALGALPLILLLTENIILAF